MLAANILEAGKHLLCRFVDGLVGIVNWVCIAVEADGAQGGQITAS
jgi:hypothetical protein